MGMKIITIIGARPQFIKSAVVSRAIRNINLSRRRILNEIIVHTGQHYDVNMSQVFFDELDICTPYYNLGIGNLGHGAMTGRMLEKIEEILLEIRPDWVIVYGDTNSTLAGSLASKKLGLKLAHVEAGLRSFDMKMPEEQNRIVTDCLSDLLFCPTGKAVENLKNEGVLNSPYGQKVFNVGDVMYDAVLFYSHIAEMNSSIIDRLRIDPERYILVTIHRSENTDDYHRLENILTALQQIAERKEVILPLHPRTREVVSEKNLSTGEIRIIDPISYFDMLLLEKKCEFIITDSGGIQKEAYFFQKPCITIRDQTEWVELVSAGVNQIVGADKTKIIAAADKINEQQFDFSQGFFGKGNAGKRIVDIIVEAEG